MKKASALGGICALLLLIGCSSNTASMTPQQKVFSQYGQILSDAVGVYTATMQAAGQAHALGLIKNSDLVRVKAIGAKVQVTLETAKASLKLYLSASATNTNASSDAVVNDLLAVQQVLTELLQATQQYGLTKTPPAKAG